MIKTKKKGFTLAEALIAMGILGIIATTLIPQVDYSIKKNRNAAVLAKSVQQVETGCKNVIEYYNNELGSFADSRYHGYSEIPIIMTGSAFMTGTRLFNNGTNAKLFNFGENITSNNSRRTGYTAKTYNKTANMTAANGLFTSNTNALSNGLYASAKTGAFIGIGGTFTANNDNTRSDDPIVDIIFIDVNAENKPNELGKDIFIFGLTDKCNMIPAGSPRMVLIGYPALVFTNCTNAQQGAGLGCAYQVVKDGYKINY